mmetsp:Transcript_16292/g.29637  ORF Transcript_16292/g.29637 Transcript_16292/m.29637 type:complete len:90 (+) Transcript_16292:161-430(+)
MHSGFDTLRSVCGMNIGVRAELFCMKDHSSKPQLQHEYASLVRVNVYSNNYFHKAFHPSALPGVVTSRMMSPRSTPTKQRTWASARSRA